MFDIDKEGRIRGYFDSVNHSIPVTKTESVVLTGSIECIADKLAYLHDEMQVIDTVSINNDVIVTFRRKVLG